MPRFPRLSLRTSPKSLNFPIALGAAAYFLTACAAVPEPNYEPQPYVQVEHPEWAKDAVIYQLNTRQFTAEGTFAAAEEHLPRIADLGADIIWLMPIHPIGEKNRKGSLGSPYAVGDFRAVNPELGTVSDLRSFIDAAHDLGLKVIIDWVANHSAWDNPLTQSNPDWYVRNWDGEFQPPLGTDWADVIDFDYTQTGLRRYMTEAMVYWVRDVGIDGFRADVAGYVPLDFWETVRGELNKVRPVFMLAEWETRDMHRKAFDATYAWGWKEAMQPIARGEKDVTALRGYVSGQLNTWPHDAYRMVYTSNHDQNSWDGTASEVYGDALEAAIVLSFVTEGVPLIYNGQEAGLDHQLAFFDKDEIIWRDHPHARLFAKLAELKRTTQALWNGEAGARMEEVATDAPEEVYAFVRESDVDQVFAVFNLSDTTRTVSFEITRQAGNYLNVFTDEQTEFAARTRLSLEPWEYRVFKRSVETD